MRFEPGIASRPVYTDVSRSALETCWQENHDDEKRSFVSNTTRTYYRRGARMQSAMLCVMIVFLFSSHAHGQGAGAGLRNSVVPSHASTATLIPALSVQAEPVLPPEIGGFLGTGLGSLVGVFGGVLFGEHVFYPVTGCCGGGDDPGLLSNMAFALAGSIVVGGVGGYLGTRAQKVPFTRMLAGSAGGAGAGLLVAVALSQLDADEPATIGYFVTQAAFNALIARASARP
jgi:hypothetical protein